MVVHNCLNLCHYYPELCDIPAIQMVQARQSDRHTIDIETHKKVSVPNYLSDLLGCACCKHKFYSVEIRCRLHYNLSVIVRVFSCLRVLHLGLYLALRVRYVYWIRLSLLQLPKTIRHHRDESAGAVGRHE